MSFAQEVAIQGPFGLHAGISKKEVILLVGRRAIKEVGDDSLTLSTVPKPHPSFEEYILVFSPEKGLVKLIASGKTIRTNDFGEELRDAFVDTRDSVSKTYGEPETFDALRAGSAWDRPEYWMMGLLKKERSLVAFWKPLLTNRILIIELDTVALSLERGYVILTYEFSGFSAYLDSKKSKAGKVF